MTRFDINETLKSVDAEAKVQAFHLSQFYPPGFAPHCGPLTEKGKGSVSNTPVPTDVQSVTVPIYA